MEGDTHVITTLDRLGRSTRNKLALPMNSAVGVPACSS